MKKAEFNIKVQHSAKKPMVVAALVMMVLDLTLCPVQVRSQVFLTDEDLESNIRVPVEDFWIPVPYQGGDADQFLPIGSGVWVLTAFGGAYLLRKRKKSKD